MMTIIEILDHLQDSYGKPNLMTLFNKDTLFHSSMTPCNSPEMLFYRIEQCQKIQHIGKVLYSDDQIIDTAVRILVTSNMFPLKEFDAWESIASKTYPALKTFFHKAYGCCLTALELRSMSGKNRYVSQTIYNILEGNDTDGNTVTTITQTAATSAAGPTTMAAGTSGVTSNAYSLTINVNIAVAINQLLASSPQS
jgi:hypothetical protein